MSAVKRIVRRPNYSDGFSAMTREPRGPHGVGAETLEEEHGAEVDHPDDPPQVLGSPHGDLKRRMH